MLNELLEKLYGIRPLKTEKSSVGAGSDTYFVTASDGRYVLKFPSQSRINHPDLEPKLCEFLLQKGVSVSQFLKSLDGRLICEDENGRIFHLQRLIEGKTYELNSAPEWLMRDSARTLGKIHTALSDYEPLPVGIGEDFFKYMTPQNAKSSYENSLGIAEKNGDKAIAEDLRYRLGLMERFPDYKFDFTRLTVSNTHGDYFISQLICGENRINAVIDWTTACRHPVVWELMRSFVYAAPSCAEGEINLTELSNYVGDYMKYAPLSKYDLENMTKLFYYQIAVCDYYGQYYSSATDNREIFLHQATFSTKLMTWFEANIERMAEGNTLF